jgi:ribosomal-protein-alanine N-acetyltransferase
VDEAASVYESAAFAEDDEPRLIGYAGLLAGVGEAEVLTIAVAPGHEGRGLGAVLLTELMREAARRECDDVVLEVRVDNDRAQQLYRRFGFEGVGVRKGYYQPMNIDALVMRSGDVIERFGDGDGEKEGGAQGADRNGARGTGMDSVDWVRE